jgi:hypothetical protein
VAPLLKDSSHKFNIFFPVVKDLNASHYFPSKIRGSTLSWSTFDRASLTPRYTSLTSMEYLTLKHLWLKAFLALWLVVYGSYTANSWLFNTHSKMLLYKCTYLHSRQIGDELPIPRYWAPSSALATHNHCLSPRKEITMDFIILDIDSAITLIKSKDSLSNNEVIIY